MLPGTRMGAKGYMGARIQPNSPTDHPEDVVWQVFDAFAYATGDIVIGTNPVDSTVTSVVAVESALKDIVDTFGLQDMIPWCVLSHIDVQAEVAESYPARSPRCSRASPEPTTATRSSMSRSRRS